MKTVWLIITLLIYSAKTQCSSATSSATMHNAPSSHEKIPTKLLAPCVVAQQQRINNVFRIAHNNRNDALNTNLANAALASQKLGLTKDPQ